MPALWAGYFMSPMAGTIPHLSLSIQFDKDTSAPLRGGDVHGATAHVARAASTQPAGVGRDRGDRQPGRLAWIT